VADFFDLLLPHFIVLYVISAGKPLKFKLARKVATLLITGFGPLFRVAFPSRDSYHNVTRDAGYAMSPFALCLSYLVSPYSNSSLPESFKSRQLI
jgi:hypothetical protein